VGPASKNAERTTAVPRARRQPRTAPLHPVSRDCLRRENLLQRAICLALGSVAPRFWSRCVLHPPLWARLQASTAIRATKL